MHWGYTMTEEQIENMLVTARKYLQSKHPRIKGRGIRLLNDALHEYGVHVSLTETNVSPSYGLRYNVRQPEGDR